jgi:Domain of unknown function (DUF151)
MTTVKVPSRLTFTRAPVFGRAGAPGGPPPKMPWERAYSLPPGPNSTSTSRGLPDATSLTVVDPGRNATTYATVVVDGPQGTAEVDARPSDALVLALVVGASVRADRAVVETTETDQTAAEGLAAIDSEEPVGAQALLDEITQANERQTPPKPAGP